MLGRPEPGEEARDGLVKLGIEHALHIECISQEELLHRYAPEKCSVRQVINHLNDTERTFLFRAVWFARGLDSPLPSYDQTAFAAAARADGEEGTRKTP